MSEMVIPTVAEVKVILTSGNNERLLDDDELEIQTRDSCLFVGTCKLAGITVTESEETNGLSTVGAKCPRDTCGLIRKNMLNGLSKALEVRRILNTKY